MGAAAPPLLHQRTSVKIDSIGVRHWKDVFGGNKTLNEIWRKKIMRQRELTMKGLGFSLARWRTLFISNFFMGLHEL
jgi:hypothetical protein